MSTEEERMLAELRLLDPKRWQQWDPPGIPTVRGRYEVSATSSRLVEAECVCGAKLRILCTTGAARTRILQFAVGHRCCAPSCE